MFEDQSKKDITETVQIEENNEPEVQKVSNQRKNRFGIKKDVLYINLMVSIEFFLIFLKTKADMVDTTTSNSLNSETNSLIGDKKDDETTMKIGGAAEMTANQCKNRIDIKK